MFHKSKLMKLKTWRKHHKWLGLGFCFFMIMFCLSGIVLNHRGWFADVDVNRNLLPPQYHYKNWNNGLLRGTLPYTDNDSVNSILVYGTGGVWKTDAQLSQTEDMNVGFPKGVDYRNIRNMAQTPSGDLFAVSPFGLFRYHQQQWENVVLPDKDAKLTDMAMKGDTLVVASRSCLYVSPAPYDNFSRIQLKAPADYDGKVSLFRTVWLLHSGELFGLIGKILVDAIAIILILLCITGLLYWLMPKYIKRKSRRGEKSNNAPKMLKWSFKWHDKIGRTTIVLTLFIAITGWCLRPPVLIALATNKTHAIPGTTLSSDNAWNDKLRVIRYDEKQQDWLLSTSEGFYTIRHFTDTPKKLDYAPPVSVMGLNVLQKDTNGNWLCGSFSGMFIWNREQNTAIDYYTHEPAPTEAGPPFGKKAIAGYSNDFAGKQCAVEFYEGCTDVPQPEVMEDIPMSLWNVALEVHTGRIYMGVVATYIFIFIAGIIAVWCLWSGWKIRKRKKQ